MNYREKSKEELVNALLDLQKENDLLKESVSLCSNKNEKLEEQLSGQSERYRHNYN